VTLLLVRHAEPVPPGDPAFEENERPLSATGRAQAESLADELARPGVTAVYTSPYLRAAQTIEPLAERLGLAERHRTSVGIVASHGNAIALAIHRLAPGRVDFAFWRAMPMPAVYRVEPDGRAAGPGLDVAPGAG
jgi:broad specificity phosphatase PhoE